MNVALLKAPLQDVYFYYIFFGIQFENTHAQSLSSIFVTRQTTILGRTIICQDVWGFIL